MQHRYRIMLISMMGLSLLGLGSLWNTFGPRWFGPDWIALYEQKLGQPIEELSEAPLRARLKGDDWDQARITSADLEDGSMLLLGLPRGRFSSSEDIVDQTVVLRLDDARQRCQEVLEPKGYSWSWDGSVDEETTRFVIQATPWTPWKAVGDGTSTESFAIPSPTDPYCELVFLDQWRLNVVRPVGVIAAAP